MSVACYWMAVAGWMFLGIFVGIGLFVGAMFEG
jgi:hypothetical protein